MRVCIAGAGAVGRSIARELIGNGHQVLGERDEVICNRPVPTPSPWRGRR